MGSISFLSLVHCFEMSGIENAHNVNRFFSFRFIAILIEEKSNITSTQSHSMWFITIHQLEQGQYLQINILIKEF